MLVKLGPDVVIENLAKGLPTISNQTSQPPGKKSISVPRAIWISWAHDMFAWHSLKDVFVRTCSAMFPVTHFRETSWDLRACLTENSVEQAKEKKDEKEKDSKKQEKKVEKACATFVDTFHQYIYLFIYTLIGFH